MSFDSEFEFLLSPSPKINCSMNNLLAKRLNFNETHTQITEKNLYKLFHVLLFNFCVLNYSVLIDWPLEYAHISQRIIRNEMTTMTIVYGSMCVFSAIVTVRHSDNKNWNSATTKKKTLIVIFIHTRMSNKYLLLK